MKPKYIIGLLGIALWTLSWLGLASFWPVTEWFGRMVSSGGIFMLVTGGIGYILLIVSQFLRG